MKKTFMTIVAVMPLMQFATPESNFSVLKQSAEKGDANAMCEMGRRCSLGIEVNANQKLASKWMLKAASNGCMRAKGLCYRFGYGVETNMIEAVKWFRRAVASGDVSAMNDLGWAYRYGKGVEKDLHAAIKWYSDAAKQGNIEALYDLLGMCNLCDPTVASHR